MQGRNKLPTQLKVLRGTDRKDRMVPNEMAPSKLEDIPYAPDFLTDRGKEEWYIVCTELKNLQMLYKVDLSLVAAYCNEMSVYFESEQLLRQKGRVMTIKNEDGSLKYMQQVPHVAIARNALKTALQIATQFGFTPASRTRISIGQLNNDSNNKDPWDDL